jgi:two-component system, OmpR family, sensor histidine kinase ArlS
LSGIDVKGENLPSLEVKSSTHELNLLTQRFNELLERTNAAFSFQKHTIHHISHELKTPISVLVSELEKAVSLDNSEEIKEMIKSQISNAKMLGNIIHVLLELAKLDSGQDLKKESTRIDELIFDSIAELSIIHPDFSFDLHYHPETPQESALSPPVNRLLMRQALMNLFSNCISFSDNYKGTIRLDCSKADFLVLSISNSGATLGADEEKFLFNHFFRGANSRNKTGFGLGLVLTRRILELHNAEIRYFSPSANLNVFEVCFTLS